MMSGSDISILGLFITALSFFGVALYAFIRQKDLHRTTRNSSILFYMVIGISLAFAAINISSLASKIPHNLQTNLSANVDLVIQYSSILVQSALIVILFANKIIVQSRTRPGRVLAVGAHPDDIEIAAGATLSKMRDAGYQITGLVMTCGEKGGRAEARPKEAKSGGEFVGLDNVQVLSFTDTRLSADMVKITEAIHSLIEKIQPDIIFTHSVHDLHQDHQTVYDATLRAAHLFRTTILCYESPSVTEDFHPTYFIDVEKYVNVKIHAIRKHWDQHKKPYTKANLVRGKLAYRGAQANVDFAEGFEVARMISAI